MIVSRSHLYSGLVVIGFANGVSERVSDALARDGAVSALLDTFGVSVVVWAAAVAVTLLLLRAPQQPAGRMDIALAVAALIAFLIPIPQLSWLALTALAFHLALTVPAGPIRRAAVVLCAMTVPMFWARILFAALSGPILAIDATLVGWIVGTESTGNMIPFADGSGVLFLEPACSSLANVSLVFLCGVLMVKLHDLPWSAGAVRAILAACVVTVAINVIRMSTIAVLPTHYDVIHGPVGATTAEWITILVVMGIYARGMLPNAPAHA